MYADRPVAEDAAASLWDVFGQVSGSDAASEALGNLDHDTVGLVLRQLAARLTDVERAVLTRRMFTDDPEAFDMIGKNLGLSREAVQLAGGRVRAYLLHPLTLRRLTFLPAAPVSLQGNRRSDMP